jgi:hypothetical protein
MTANDGQSDRRFLGISIIRGQRSSDFFGGRMFRCGFTFCGNGVCLVALLWLY